MDQKSGKKLQLQIVTPYELFYEGKVDELVLPALDGNIGIWPGRTPIIIALNPGELRMTREDEEYSVSIAAGYSSVEEDNVVVVVNSAEWPEKIDVKRAQSALDRAKARLKDPSVSEREKERSRRSLMRAKTRLKVAKKAAKEDIV